MILVYAPEGANERRWTFKLEKLLSSEAEALERLTKKDYPAEFGTDLIKGSATCRRALLWVFLKREDAPLRITQVDPPVGAISVEYEADELRAMRDAILDDDTLTDEERADVVAHLEAEIGDTGEAEAPKADVSSSASST